MTVRRQGKLWPVTFRTRGPDATSSRQDQSSPDGRRDCVPIETVSWHCLDDHRGQHGECVVSKTKNIPPPPVSLLLLSPSAYPSSSLPSSSLPDGLAEAQLSCVRRGWAEEPSRFASILEERTHSWPILWQKNGEHCVVPGSLVAAHVPTLQQSGITLFCVDGHASSGWSHENVGLRNRLAECVGKCVRGLWWAFSIWTPQL